MKTIPLTQSHVALVDDEDYDFLMQWNWHVSVDPNGLYAKRNVKLIIDGKTKKTTVFMHRVILNLLNSDLYVDHADHNGLNNQRSNLRVATKKENCRNKKKQNGFSSLFLGVHRHFYRKKNWTKWQAKVTQENGRRHIGYFPFTPCGELLAAISYDIAAEKHYGEFANLNFKVLQ